MRFTVTSPKLKECNSNLVRWALLESGGATKPWVADHTGISLMTVGKIINAMAQSGEVVSEGIQDSAFGRKAERYAVNPDFCCSMALRFLVGGVDVVIADAVGRVRLEQHLPMEPGFAIADLKPGLAACLAGLPPLKSLVAGFPAAVFDGRLHSGHLRQFLNVDVQQELDALFDLPVLMGRDMNICAIGYSRQQLSPCSSEPSPLADLMYLFLDEAGYGGGSLAGGRVLRGFRHFAGEIGRMPLSNGKFLREFIDSGVNDDEYVDVLAKMLGSVTCVLNPSVVVFSGSSVRPWLLERIRQRLGERIGFRWEGQEDACPDLIYEESLWPSYRAGMIYAATRRLHSGVCLVDSE